VKTFRAFVAVLAFAGVLVGGSGAGAGASKNSHQVDAVLTASAPNGSFLSTSADGKTGILVFQSLDPQGFLATDKERVALPAADVAGALSQRDSVEAIVVLPGAKKSEDRADLTLTNVHYNEDIGFSANATIDDTVQSKLLRPQAKGLDQALPGHFGRAQLLAAAPATPVDGASRPSAPPKGSTGYTVNVSIDVTGPAGLDGGVSSYAGGQCIKNQASSGISQSFNGHTTVKVSFTVDDSFGCFVTPSIAVWEVQLLRKGDSPLQYKWAYITVSQYAPHLYSSECHGVGQVGRITCSGSQFNAPDSAPVTMNVPDE
jgi:hypothetical protein